MSISSVLVIDDNLEMRQLLKSMIATRNVTVVEAESAEMGLAEFNRNPSIKVIFVDVDMEKMSGFDFLAAIQVDKEIRGVKVCMVTGHKSTEDVIKAKKLGADDYIVKPILTATFINKFNKLFIEKKEEIEILSVNE